MEIELPMRFEDHALMWVVDDVYTPEECAQRVSLIEERAPARSSVNTGYRDQDRVMIDDHAAAADLFTRLAPSLPERLGPFELLRLNERFRYYRYAPGQRFSPHMDHWYRPSESEITLLTVLVYFNEGFEGGETRFMEQAEAVVEPKPGARGDLPAQDPA